MARLRILSGAHAGQTLACEGELSIGRSRGSTGRLEDKAIGFKHAVIRRANGGWEVLDARSLHGTFVNGQRLERDVPRPLQPGDALRFGDIDAVFELDPEPTAPPPAAAPASPAAGDADAVTRLEGEVLALRLRNRDLEDELVLVHGSDETLRELRRLREELAQAIEERDLLARRAATLEAEVERLTRT